MLHFCVRVGKFLDLYVMFCDWIYALMVLGLSLNLLGHHVMAYFDRLRSMYDRFASFCSLDLCGMMCCMLSNIYR